jgi:hypothetical protein
VMADHFEDEEKHFVYFSKLLEYLWALLGEHEHQEIGVLLPQFIQAFLEPDYGAIERILANYGLKPVEVKQIIDESYAGPQMLADMRRRAEATLQQFEYIDVFKNQQVLQVFQTSGLID